MVNFDRSAAAGASTRSASGPGKLCKAISNKRAIKKAAVEAFPQAPSHSWATDKGDQQRLKCFDALFNTRPNPPPATPDYSAKQGNRRIEQSKSPTDGAPLVNAANLVGDTVLILRCKDQTTEAALSTKYNWCCIRRKKQDFARM